MTLDDYEVTTSPGHVKFSHVYYAGYVRVIELYCGQDDWRIVAYAVHGMDHEPVSLWLGELETLLAQAKDLLGLEESTS